MKRKLAFLMALLMATAFIFTACEEDDKNEDDGPAEIAQSDYTNYLPGEWKDGYATRHFCDDGSWYFEFSAGDDRTGTWELDGNELTLNESDGDIFLWTIDKMYEDECHFVSQESGTEMSAELQSEDGCYFLEAEQYEDNIPGKWRRPMADNDIYYYLCDDGTFYTQTVGGDNHLGPYSWYYSNGELVLDYPQFNLEYDIVQMSSDKMYLNDDGREEIFTLASSDGCYEPPMGSAVFYLTEDCGCGEVEIEIDGDYVGTLDSYFTSGDVSCGQDGAVTVDLEPGTYSVYAECSDSYWEFDVTIEDGKCSQEELACKKRKMK